MVFKENTGSCSIRVYSHNRRLQQLFSPRGIIFLLVGCIIFFHLIGRHVVRQAFAHIYMPPALTQEKAIVFDRFITLVKTIPAGRIHLDMFGGRWMEKYDLVEERENHLISEMDYKLLNISQDFKRVGCLRAERYDTYVVFIYKSNYVFPTSPGVLYSLDGRNPNDINDGFLDKRKPFKLIKNQWYTSRLLAVVPFGRIDSPWLLPKSSLIDHSLKDPGGLAGEKGSGF